MSPSLWSTAKVIFLTLAAGMMLGLGPASPPKRLPLVREAEFYEKLDRKLVRCRLCPRYCTIAPGQRGVCRVRENKDGKLYSVVYGRPCTIGKEPIEKAPFFHFLPGSSRIVLATAGCNQMCKYCQNWEISQSSPEDLPNYDLPPESIVAIAKRENAPIVCFTFSEPIVFYEYMADIAQLCRKSGIRTAVVTGGYINPQPLSKLCSLVDAIKIDLKGFTDDFYRDVCSSSLEPVLEACKIVARSPGIRRPVHLELVNLVVPALNDDTAGLRKMCSWIRDSLGDTVPVHFTRFTPNYKLANSPPTPIATLERAAIIAKAAGIKYVYVGNVPGHWLENTYCPKCGKLLIKRQSYAVTENNIKNNCCRFCKTRIPGVWQ
ncbi:MAG: AmmeMemoRadiSam system radical SAM enzyme [candidate division WOR-3 bacterium]